MKVNVIKAGAINGLICGLIGILIMYGSWAMSLQTFVSVSFWVNFIPYIIIITIFSGFQLRKANENFLPYKEALKFSFLTYVVVACLIAISTYILYNVIDKELTAKSMQIVLEKTRAMMEKFGASEEEIEKAIKKAQAEPQETGAKKIFLGTGLFLIWDFVKSLLLALIIRKEKKVFDQPSA